MSQLPVEKQLGNIRAGSANNMQVSFAKEEEEDSVAQDKTAQRKRKEKADYKKVKKEQKNNLTMEK